MQGHCGGAAATDQGSDRQKAGECEAEEEERHCATGCGADLPLHGTERHILPEVSLMEWHFVPSLRQRNSSCLNHFGTSKFIHDRPSGSNDIRYYSTAAL